jgi:hypothetical protein
MGFALLPDRLGIMADQRVNRFEPLLWWLFRLPTSDDPSEQGDERIGPLLVLETVCCQRFVALVMSLLHPADEHRREIIQGLSGADPEQGHRQGHPL